MIDYSKIISDGGHYLTQALFYEFRYQTKAEYIPYTLRERDHGDYLSMYKIYMACDSEYEAAQKLLNSWKHWEILCASPWFAPEIAKWREEREIKDAALGKSVLIEKAQEGNVPAARALFDATVKRKAGRPSALEVTHERKKQAAIDSKVSNIIDRMAKKS